MSVNRSELLGLKNLGIASVNIINAVGIHTREELAHFGAVEVYCRIVARDINVSKVMLYALHGALVDRHWSELSTEVKDRLVREAQAALATDSLVS
ncbi:TfoX/Sxy family protein [Marinimicrobium alkaliphilum]|uniref:TfoX/Sxy family protein n=1 Tax=Marinimicrobium alkaliphilum TaxID=2202654 RepID=UPI000DB95C72|nr:TfoX/Sxy family protein [Marinimicrobium alkaliphilum]